MRAPEELLFFVLVFCLLLLRINVLFEFRLLTLRLQSEINGFRVFTIIKTLFQNILYHHADDILIMYYIRV